MLLLLGCIDTNLSKLDPPSGPMVAIEPAAPVTTDTLRAVLVEPGVDPSGEVITYTWAWTRDGAEAGDTDTVDAADTTRDETWTVAVTAYAGDRQGGTGTATVVIANTPPTVSVALVPDVVVAGDTLTAEMVAEDADEDALMLSLAWTVDGTPAGTDTTLGGFVRGQVVTVTATADDATDASTASASLTVGNTAPAAPAVRITPAEPGAGDTLVCEATGSDADGDALSYTAAWSVDGTSWGDTTTTTWPGDTVPGSAVAAGQTWLCAMTPSDGTTTGPVGTASVTVTGPASACPDPDGNCALRFDGIDDYVAVPDDPSLDGGGTALTVEAWLYWDWIDGNCMTAVRKGTATSPTYDYWLHKNWAPADSLFWGSWTGYTAQAFSAITAGRWTHYAGVYDPSLGQARLYIDGVLLSTATPHGTPTANDDDLRIGIDWDMGCPMAGVIDEVRLSSVARYTSDFTPAVSFAADADTRALWHFDTYEGSIAYDASGNGNDGTIVGATWTTEHP